MTSWLRARWPRAKVPWISLGNWPSPVRSFPTDAATSVWLKDEGVVAPHYGGQEVRKLEFVLGAATERGAGDVLAVGGVGSHRVVALAAHARALGLRPHAVLLPQPDTPMAQVHARVLDMLCESWVVARHWSRVPLGMARALLHVRVLERQPLFVRNLGASHPLAVLGWMGAGLELASQVEAGELPEPAQVYVPLEGGATAAGVWLGMRLGGLRTEVVAVPELWRARANSWYLRGLARRTVRWLEPRGARLSMPGGGPRVLHWSEPEVEGSRIQAVLAQGQAAGLALEPAGRSRALRACVEAAHTGASGPLLFWQTANAHSLEPWLSEALPTVPARMQAMLGRAGSSS